MKTKQAEVRKYRTLEDFEQAFFPASREKELRQADDPRVFGVNLARESVSRISSLIASKRCS